MLWDLGILWEWEHDERFVKLLDSFCQRSGKTSYLVFPRNLEESMLKIKNGELWFRVIFDRATDSDPRFMPIVRLHQQARSRIINEPEKAFRTYNKAQMHLELMKSGLYVPYTILLPPGDRIDDKGLESVGRPFVIKQVAGEGGGEGVVLGAKTVEEVQLFRKENPEKLVLVQELVVPRQYRQMRCWFRVFFVCGKIIPCFWDDLTHVYQRLTGEEEIIFDELKRITNKIHEITGLEFFSTEVVHTEDGRYVVVDYVNDQCDMRFQSDTPDGVPDFVIEEIVTAVAESL